MLQKKLQGFWYANRFATSWIVGTNDLEKSLQDIKCFAQDIINVAGLPIDNNPDFRIVRREETKYINVDQIRDLQQFLYTTSTVGEYKFAVIYEADSMNNNASNCCLKILEEPPRQSYLFLLTKEPASLSATIKSRCHKLHTTDENQVTNDTSYIDYMQSIMNMNTAQKIKWLQDVSGKTKIEAWDEFCQNSIGYLSRNVTSKKSLNNFEKIQKMIRDTGEFDLDKRHMGILILEAL
jgi:DNA polymerase-3 subunit delta'